MSIICYKTEWVRGFEGIGFIEFVEFLGFIGLMKRKRVERMCVK